METTSTYVYIVINLLILKEIIVKILILKFHKAVQIVILHKDKLSAQIF